MSKPDKNSGYYVVYNLVVMWLGGRSLEETGNK